MYPEAASEAVGRNPSLYRESGGADTNQITGVVVQYEFLMASSLVDGVILSVAVLQAERRISRYDTVCNGRSLGPLATTRALRDDALRDSEFKLTHYQITVWRCASFKFSVHFALAKPGAGGSRQP
jgi:hypothetical protein